MKRRLLSAAVLLVIVWLGFFVEGFGWLVVGLAGLIGALCTLELAAMLQTRGVRIFRRVATLGVLALMIEAMTTGLRHGLLVFGIAICAAWIVRLRGRIFGAWNDIAGTIFTLAYIGVPMAVLARLFTASDASRGWLLLGLVVVWSTDSCALFVGRSIGRTKLWPKISPGKTWEGTLGGIVGALLVIVLLRLAVPQYLPTLNEYELMAFGLLFAVIGQFGDLAESLLKRDIGVKDSGSELTGHGGFLDLMDAALFMAVPLLLYLRLFHGAAFPD